jgi:hypothetical protein
VELAAACFYAASVLQMNFVFLLLGTVAVDSILGAYLDVNSIHLNSILFCLWFYNSRERIAKTENEVLVVRFHLNLAMFDYREKRQLFR